jgi:UDP-hydrolysing UDP-N-acetyl-D-glucosamine 2-epimerase
MGQPVVKKRMICVVTTTRADYGLLKYLMQEIREDPDLVLQIIATGMHLSGEFGRTVDAIEQDGFHVNRCVEMLLSSDSETAIIKSMGVAMISFADVLQEVRPDIIVLLGDRFEIVPVALSAVVHRIPVAHLHGGETSEGAMDESFRHAVTKLSSIHFPATEAYRRRIIRMGEAPDRVHTFGAPGLDALYRLQLYSRIELEHLLQFSLEGITALITYHPVTLEQGTAQSHIDNLLEAVKRSSLRGVFTKANADTGGMLINQRVAAFCASDPSRFKLFDSLGQHKYLSCLKCLDLMLGNSSSGLIEAPSFGMPVVNIGDRQKGRLRAGNIIDAGTEVEQIRAGITKALSREFREGLKTKDNPYDQFRDGRTSFRIKEKLKHVDISDRLLKKSFWESEGEDCRGSEAAH